MKQGVDLKKLQQGQATWQHMAAQLCSRPWNPKARAHLPKIRMRQVICCSPARPRGSAWAVRPIASRVQAMPPVAQWLDAVRDAESNGRLKVLGNAAQTPTHWSDEGARVAISKGWEDTRWRTYMRAPVQVIPQVAKLALHMLSA